MDKRPVLMGLLALAAIGFHPADGNAANLRDHERERDRRVKIAPVDQSTGVAAGLVIAYGHALRPPYRFKYAGSTLFVNGVQLVPSPIAAEDDEKVRVLVKDDRRKLLRELERVQARAKEMFEARRSHEEILQYVKSQPSVVADAKWEGERVMVFRLAGDKHFMHMLQFQGLTQKTKKQAQGTVDPQEVQKRLIDQYERDLASGVCLFFSSDNGVMRIADPRAKVVEIMEKGSLSKEDRERAMLEVFPMNRIAAYDVLANYMAGEWAQKRK